jgi:hypothetical protein
MFALPHYWLPRPSLDLDSTTLAACERLYQTEIRDGQGNWLTPPIAPWQFFCWLADTQPILLHGSGNPDISHFEARQSNDIDEFGNRQAVYAASDGLWPMFFAVTDRQRYRMTSVNAAIRLEIGGQWSDPHYFFSITDHVLAQQPWREGTVYVLPRTGFEEQAPYRLGAALVHRHHWASPQAVRPLAKIRVQATDFPLLAQIRGQDDELLAQRVEQNPDGFPWLE